MKAKWCFSTLIVILTLFGVYHQNTSVANQEIVLQFADHDITSDEAQNTIAAVKEQLLIIGVDNIQVREAEDGRLKITYYSDADVASIEKILSEEKKLAFDHTSPDQNKEETKDSLDKDTNAYNLDVYEIQDGTDGDWDIEGIHVVELKSENHRFFNPDIYTSVSDLDDTQRLVKVSYKIHSNIAIAIDNTSHKIPDVRAGPITCQNS